mgnify:CR=1 FL=1
MKSKLITLLLLAALVFGAGAQAKEIRVLVANHPYGDLLKQYIPEYEKATGVKVNVESLQESQLTTKLTTEFATNSSSADVFMTRPLQEGKMFYKNGWYEPLTSYDFSDYPESAMGVARFGKLDILYANAGVLWKDRDRSVIETTEANWDIVQAINLKGPFFLTKHGIPELKKAGGGSIILVGSISALVGFTLAQDSYTCAKGALISLAKSLAVQFGPDHIRCNIIHPGMVDTPLQAPYLDDNKKRAIAAELPLRRLGLPDRKSVV